MIEVEDDYGVTAGVLEAWAQVRDSEQDETRQSDPQDPPLHGLAKEGASLSHGLGWSPHVVVLIDQPKTRSMEHSLPP